MLDIQEGRRLPTRTDRPLPDHADGKRAGTSRGNTSGPAGPPTLCYHGALNPELWRLAPTGFCQQQRLHKYGAPGGAVCEDAPNVAQCNRPWE